MILHLNGKPLKARLCWRFLWDSPAFQNSVHFQAQIIMQPSGSMFLNNVDAPLILGLPFLWLSCLFEIFFARNFSYVQLSIASMSHESSDIRLRRCRTSRIS